MPSADPIQPWSQFWTWRHPNGFTGHGNSVLNFLRRFDDNRAKRYQDISGILTCVNAPIYEGSHPKRPSGPTLDFSKNRHFLRNQFVPTQYLHLPEPGPPEATPQQQGQSPPQQRTAHHSSQHVNAMFSTAILRETLTAYHTTSPKRPCHSDIAR